MALPTDNQGTDRKGATSSASSARPAMSTPVGGHVAIRPLRTYKDDLAEAIKKGGYSATSVQEAERKKKEREKAATPPREERPAPRQTRDEEPRAPRVMPPSSPPPQTQPPLAPQQTTVGRKTFFSQLLAHRKEAREESPEEKQIPPPAREEHQVTRPQEKPAPAHVIPAPARTPLPPRVSPERPQERRAFIPPPAPVKVSPPPLPRVAPPIQRPLPPQQTPLSRDTVRFIEEHAVGKNDGLSSLLPSWATPGETKAEREAEERARQEKLRPVMPVFQPKLPLITREAPTRGSAVVSGEEHPFPMRPAVIATVGVVVILVIGFGGYSLFKNPAGGDNNGKPLVSSSQFISVTSTTTFDAANLSGTVFIDAYKTKEQGVAPARSTRGIITTTKETGVDGKESVRALRTSEFFIRATPTAPGILVRALGDTLTSGVYGSVGGNSGFIISTAENYARALGGLLSWEPKMWANLAPLLLAKVSYGVPFTDKMITGVPVRVLGSGEDALVYGFIDKKVLLIARGEGAFGALADMIRTQKQPVK